MQEQNWIDSCDVNINSWLFNDDLLYEDRFRKLDSLLLIAKKTYGDSSYSSTYFIHKSGVLYHVKGLDGDLKSFDEAISYYQKALEMRKKLHSKTLKEDIVNGYSMIGICYAELNDIPNSITNILQGLKLLEGTPISNSDFENFCYLNTQAARSYATIGDFDNSLKYYQSIINSQSDTILKESIWNFRAQIELAGLYADELYRPKEALIILNHCEKIKSFLGESVIDMDVASLYNKKGIAFMRYLQYDSAVNNFKKAAKAYEKLNDISSEANNLMNIGIVYTRQSLIDSGYFYFNKVNDSIINKSFLHENLGDLAFKEEKYKVSLEHYNKAITEIVSGFNPKDIYSNPVIDPEKYQISDKIRLYNSLGLKGNTLLQLYRKSKNERCLNFAFETYNKADQVIGMMRSEFQAEASRLSLASYAKPIYEQGIEACYQLYQLNQQDSILEKAFEFSEKSRAIALLDAVRKTKASARVDQELIKDEKSLNLKVNYFEKQAALYEQDSSNRASYKLYDSLLYYRRQHQEVIDQVREATPEYYSLIFDQQTTSPHKIQTTLSKDRCLIEYFLGDSSLYAFVIHKDTTFFLKQNDPDSIRRWAGDWVSSMQSLDLSFLRPSYQLYQALIQPAQDKKPLTAKISIVPDDVLNLVNFESLVTELPGEDRIYLPSFGDYLVNRHQLSYAFSATTLYETKPSNKEKQNNYLGIAPEMSEGFQLEDYWFDKLEYNEEEVLHAGSLFPQQNILESNDVKDQFIKLAPSYGLIHCATHAMANNKDGDLSFILFGEEPTDIMYAKDLYALDLNADLVVLSACQTSAGELNRGEGIISLARGFTYAGAASVVTSLWNVREKTNKEIIYDFYKLLKKGKSKDEALRIAKLNYLGNLTQENYMNAHPYFWAPLIIIGDPEPLQKNYSWREITAISLFLIFSITLVYRFRKSRMKD